VLNILKPLQGCLQLLSCIAKALLGMLAPFINSSPILFGQSNFRLGCPQALFQRFMPLSGGRYLVLCGPKLLANLLKATLRLL
jgi:hypothetical protein